MSSPDKLTWVTVQALMLYWYNVRMSEIIAHLFPSGVQTYLDDKANQAQRQGLVEFWGNLDFDHQNRLLEAALARYSGEATYQISMLEAAMANYNIEISSGS